MTPNDVRVRNSARPADEAAFSHREWNAFIAGVKAGEFDLPDLHLA